MTPQEKEDFYQQAMFSLVGNENFTQFIGKLREMREFSMRESARPKNLKSNSLYAFHAGKADAFLEIIDAYEDFVATAEQSAVESRPE